MSQELITHCYECDHCFKSKRSKTGYSCAVWGYDDFASDTVPSGFCHKAKPVLTLDSLDGLLMFDNRLDAEKIIIDLIDIAENYGCVTRADFKDLVNLPADTDDNKFGWVGSEVKKIRAVYTPRGYFIEFPRSVPIV